MAALTANLKSTPAYSAAYELELWKKAQEEAFRNKLREDEKRFRAGLEFEYDSREQ